jgi:hypothetical protein
MKAKYWLPAVIPVSTLLVTTLVLVGCGNSNQQSATEVKCEVPGNCIDLRNAKILQEPDGFRNIAFGCWDSTGVYVTSRGAYQNGNKDATPLPSDVSIVLSDPHCVAGAR